MSQDAQKVGELLHEERGVAIAVPVYRNSAGTGAVPSWPHARPLGPPPRRARGTPERQLTNLMGG